MTGPWPLYAVFDEIATLVGKENAEYQSYKDGNGFFSPFPYEEKSQ
jgi:hypothetical protein